MRKTIFLLFVFLFILSGNVFAYPFNPICEPFEALVSNKDGADYYEMDEREIVAIGKIKYNEKVDIIEEYEVENELYGLIEIENKNYYIKIDDVKSTDKFYNNINKDKTQEIIVFAQNGTKMRNGPSENYYSEIEVIPKGTKLQGYFEGTENTNVYWFMVEYNGKKGWINCNSKEFGKLYKSNRNIMILNDTEVFKDIENSKKVDTLKANTEISTENLISFDFKYTFMDEQTKSGFNIDEDAISENNYIILDDKEGYINIKKYANNTESTYILKEETPLYKEPNADSKIIVDSIPADTELSYNYYTSVGRPEDKMEWKHGIWAYTTYNGKTGWVQIVDEEYLENRDKTLNQFETVITEEETSNNKVIIICVLSVVLVILIVVLIYVRKNKNK